MPMQNPVVGGGGGLIRNWIQSPDFVAGVSGWRIARDGSAEFNNVTARGDLRVQEGNSLILITNGPPPIIILNPDTTLYDGGFIRTSAIDADTAMLEIWSASSNTGFSSTITMLSAGASTETELILGAGVVRATGYAFEGSADENDVTANSAAITPGNALDIVTVTVIAIKASSTFEIKGAWHGIGFVTPVAVPGNQATMRLTRNGTQIVSARILGHNTALTQFGGVLVKADNPGVGTHTYALSLLHEAGSTAASVHTVATANSPSTVSARGFFSV